MLLEPLRRSVVRLETDGALTLAAFLRTFLRQGSLPAHLLSVTTPAVPEDVGSLTPQPSGAHRPRSIHENVVER